MAATTLWVLSSYDENFGIAVVEAMAAGLPIVITDRVQIWPQLHRADAALVVPCEREPLAAALSRALSNSELRSRLGRTAKLLASEKFSLEAGARQLIQAYRDLRESHPKTVATMNASLGAS
jgi:glycosyltransferase involved in cell wall biosynthesis